MIRCTFWLSILLLQNWGFTHSLGWNVPAWSISTEWFAYLCFPFIAWVANRVPTGIVVAILGSLLPLAVLAFGLYLAGETLGGDIPRFGLFRCVTEFTCGIFLCRLWRQFGRQLKVICAVAAALFLLLYCISGLADYWLVPVAWASLIIALASGQGRSTAFFSSRILERIGAWSYSTYLVHYFLHDWVKFLLIQEDMNPLAPLGCYLGLTGVASVLLYRFVEVPGRRFIRHQVDSFTGQAPGAFSG